MHLYFISRGIKHERDLFVTTLQSQFWPWKRTNLKTGKEEMTLVQGSLRPVELWEYVFPEEHLPQVMAMTQMAPGMANSVDLLGAKAAFLRKSIGCKKIPKFDIPEVNRIINIRGMSLTPIGIKKDEFRDMEWGYHQEAL